MIHQATTDFINLYQSELGKWDDKRIAYEKAELIWIERNGKRKHRDYRSFRQLCYHLKRNPNRVKGLRVKTLQIIRFFEIYSFISDPYRFVHESYEIAESEYIKEYGTRRFKNYHCFRVAQTRYHQTRQRLTT